MVRRLAARSLLVLLVLTGMAGRVRADDTGAAGRTLVLSVAASSGRQALRSTQKAPGIHVGPASAASELSGTFEVVYVDTPANRAVLAMPSPWASNTGAVATYRNAAAPAGPSPVKTAKIRSGAIAKISAPSVGGIDLSVAPGPGGVLSILTVANAGDGTTHRTCSLYRPALGSRVLHRVVASGYKLTLKQGVAVPCPTCGDGIHNGLETGVDCGGAGCPACPAGEGCEGPGDCQSGICTAGVCQPVSCTNGVRDGTETGVDCGGPACAGCPAGDGCGGGTDCESGVCTGGLCQAPTCADGVRNGGETDVDCGGAPCPACVPFTVTIDTPAHGAFSQAATASVTGHTTGVGPAGADLTLNGTPVALQPGGGFAATMPLSAAAVFNPIHARLVRRWDGRTAFDRVVVIAGQSIPLGAVAPNGVGLRMNDRGLDSVEPLATTLVDIDPATLVTPGTTVLSDYCYLAIGSLCLGAVDVSISTTPPPAIGPVGIALDSRTGAVNGLITVRDLRVTVNVDNASGIPLHCELQLTVPTITIDGSYDLSPLAAQPTRVDVTQVGGASVQATGTTYVTDCDGLLGDLEEALLGQTIGDVGALFANGMQDFLNTADANGNTPIAGAIETALAGIDIAGPVGDGLGATVYAPFTSIVEDPVGITFAADIAATSLAPAPGAPAFSATYHLPEPFPAFGALTPAQHLPYGLGLAISTSGFNQLLRAQIEGGLLQTSLTTIDLGSGPVPVTAGLLAALLPPFDSLPASMPIAIRIAPTLAPVLTGATGPAGELGEIRMAQIHVEFVQSPGLPGETVLLALAVDARVGLQLAFQPGGIGFALSPPGPADVTIALLANPLGVDETTLQTFLPSLVGSFLPELASALQSFPLPQFLGLALSGLEVSRNGQFYSIFADLVPACTAGTQCPSGVCLNSVCQAPSCADGVRNGAETALDCGGGSCPGCPTGAGCFLSSDCAAGGCSGGVCQPPCSTGAQCPSGVCAGGYCRVPNCADGVQNGAETGVDCGGGSPNCLRCAPGQGCASATDCQSGVCAGGVCQAPTCVDGVRNGTETDLDCGGGSCPGCPLQGRCSAPGDCQSGVCGLNARCTCGNRAFTFTVNSNSGGVFDSAEWPGGTASQTASPGCGVTINRPNDNIDKVCTLAAPFSVAGFTGYSQCFGAGGEDGDGCQPVSCPPAGIGSCCSGRPSCSAALNGSGAARYLVQCLE